MDDQIEIRPLRGGDVPAAQELAYCTLRTAGKVYGWQMPPLDDARRERRRRSLSHVLTTDPDGCFVAEEGGRLLGVALATRRGPLWFLSLLTVAPADQGRGLGRRLLEAASRTRGDAAAVCSSDDPKALRRYRGAGLDLHPAYSAKGKLDRSRLPAGTAARVGSYDSDRDLVESVAVEQRGAPHGPDLDHWSAVHPLWIADTPAGRGYAIGGETGPAVLAATDPVTAADLLWTVLAEKAQAEVEVMWLTGAQQWAIDVALAARLALRPTGTCCLSGAVGARTPYIPNGLLG